MELYQYYFIFYDGHTPIESQCYVWLLGLNFTPTLKYNSYIHVIAIDVTRMVGSLNHSRKYINPAVRLYLYKHQIRLRREYCYHICVSTTLFWLSSLDRINKQLCNFLGNEFIFTLWLLSQRQNVSSFSLFYCYYNGRCSDELHSSVTPV